MQHAIDTAHTATRTGDVPIGAAIYAPDGVLVASGVNAVEHSGDPTRHAEMVAVSNAYRELAECTLVVTVEASSMCAGAMVLARLPRVVFGAWEPNTGASGSVLDILREPRLKHQVEVTSGVLAEQCRKLLQDFFATKR